MRFKLIRGKHHLVWRLEEKLVLSWRDCGLGACDIVSIDFNNVTIIESFSDFAQLVFVLLVVKRGAHRLYRMELFRLSILRHQ